MNSKPLDYSNLQCFLQYLEANKRLQLSQRCPSIRVAERSVPLSVKHLKFCRYLIYLNDTVYQIGVYQKYHIGTTPRDIRELNENGGASWEMDRFGIMAQDAPMTQGDVDVFGLGENQEPLRTNEERITALEQDVQRYEEGLATVQAGGVVQNFENLTVGHWEESLEQSRSALLRLQHLRDNAPTPCEQFVQLTVITKNPAETCYESSHIERYYYHNKSWAGAMKQLATIMFGGRRRLIYVGDLRFRQNRFPLRLPVGIQFRAQRIHITGPLTNVFNGIKPIIYESTYPLDHLDIEPAALEAHQVVTTAKVLTVAHFCQQVPILPALLNLPNEEVHFKYSLNLILNEELIALIEHWIANKRQIGTRWEFSFCEKDAVLGIMEAIATRFNRAAIGRRSLIIPMTNESQLEVSYSEGFDSLYLHGKPNWTIKMVVSPPIKID
ncbi:unnamed protein product [Caenorhabditis brenneri]